ncbi:MAG TPA: RHS repeat-associated core domain-containing protein [Labilithrix sp.]|nr:RHS repeat-associated core domain-containing protein [Labilithrix sp.]
MDTWAVEQGSGPTTWTFGYDAARELTSAKRHSGSTLLESPYYGYDKAGNRVQVGTGAAPPKNYDVNNLNQLLSERDHGRTTFSGFVDEPATVKVNGQAAKVTSTDGGAPYRFEGVVDLGAGANTVVVEAKDGQNNVATKSYAVTTTGTSKTFEYDANGNLRYEKQPNGTVIREYRWDQQNRLVRELHGTHESVYEYDGESHRVRIKELEGSVQTKDETFIWCGARICQKRSGSTVLRSYFKEGFEQGTDDYFYTRDHLGSVREVIASDATTIASRRSYDPWGKATESGSGALADFGFTGHYFDRPTGESLTWFRGYDPSLGRWLSMDPIGLRGGVNLYGYVNNVPVKFTDPDGHGIRRYQKCVQGMTSAPSGFPDAIILCLPWLFVPDPEDPKYTCATFPPGSLARGFCCEFKTGHYPNNKPGQLCSVPDWRTPDEQGESTRNYYECLYEPQFFPL